MFTRTDGSWAIKLVLSGYTFYESKSAYGAPDGFSDCARCVGSLCNTCTKSVPYKAAHDPNSCGYSMIEDGKWVEGSWTRVHRDKDII